MHFQYRISSLVSRYARLTLSAASIAALSVLAGSSAHAQGVYDSTANPILPAAALEPAPNPMVPVRYAADDYTTTLVGLSDTFQLSSLSFVGGVDFTGAPNGTNNVLQFRFLNEFGGITPYTVKQQFAFQTSGTQLYTLDFGNVTVPTKGILEVTTLNNSNANGTFALSSTPPSIGANNAAQGPGVRAFALNGSINSPGVPEPGTAALLLGGIAAPLAFVRRRRS